MEGVKGEREADLDVEGLLPGSPMSWGMTFLLFTGAITPLIRYRRHVRSSPSVARAGGANIQVVGGRGKNGQSWGGVELCV